MAEVYSPPTADDADFNFELSYKSLPPLAADFEFALVIYYVLAGFSNMFTAIWADSDAGRDKGKMHTLSWGTGTALSILELDNKYLHDHYTQDYAGRAEETLTDNDTRDLNVDTP